MRKINKAFLVASCFSPMFLVYSISAYQDQGLSIDVISAASLFLLLSILGWVVVFGIEKQGERMKIRISKVESYDSLPLAITSIGTWLTPGILKYFGTGIDTIRIGLIFAFLVGLSITYIPSHPILTILRYKFYKITTSDTHVVTYISKRDLRDVSKPITVIRVTEFMYFDGGSI